MTLKEHLAKRAFDLVGPDPDYPSHTLYLRQTGVRHILVSLAQDASVECLDDAIYDAGRRDQQTHIRRNYDAFTASLKHLPPLPPQ